MFFRKNRFHKLKILANQLGLSYAEADRDILPPSLERFYFTGPGDYRFHFEDLIYGWHEGIEIFIFTSYLIGNSAYSNRNNRKYSRPQSTFLFISPLLSLPHFAIIPIHEFARPHPVFDQEKISFRQKDIEFANLYVVQGRDPTQVEGFIHASVRTKMKQLANRSCEGKGDQLVFYYPGHLIKPESMPRYIEMAFSVYDLFAQPHKSAKDFKKLSN